MPLAEQKSLVLTAQTIEPAFSVTVLPIGMNDDQFFFLLAHDYLMSKISVPPKCESYPRGILVSLSQLEFLKLNGRREKETREFSPAQ